MYYQVVESLHGNHRILGPLTRRSCAILRLSRSPNLHRQARWAWRSLPIRDVDGKPGSAWEASVRFWGCQPHGTCGLQGEDRRTGLRKSLLVAPMSTASTSHILGGVRWWTVSGTDAKLGISLVTGTVHRMYCVWFRVTCFISFIPIIPFSVTSTTPFLLLSVTSLSYVYSLPWVPTTLSRHRTD